MHDDLLMGMLKSLSDLGENSKCFIEGKRHSRLCIEVIAQRTTRSIFHHDVRYTVLGACIKDRVEPLFEADFMPCSFGFRPKKTPRMALSAIVQSVNEGYSFVVDVDLKSYLDRVPYCPLIIEKVLAADRPL